jgi:hypothetical protein
MSRSLHTTIHCPVLKPKICPNAPVQVIKARKLLRATEDRHFTDRSDLEVFLITHNLPSIPHQAWANLKF